MESKLPMQNEIYNLKDPANFKQWLNVGGDNQERNSVTISRVANRVTKNLNSSEGQGNGLMRFCGKNPI